MFFLLFVNVLLVSLALCMRQQGQQVFSMSALGWVSAAVSVSNAELIWRQLQGRARSIDFKTSTLDLP